MSFRSVNPATAVVTSVGWIGIAILAFLAVWAIPGESLSWWVRITAGLTAAFIFLMAGLDAWYQELTKPRWALSQFVFATLAIVFVVAAILNSNVLGLGRALMLVLAAVYLVGAVCCMAEAKDLF